MEEAEEQEETGILRISTGALKKLAACNACWLAWDNEPHEHLYSMLCSHAPTRSGQGASPVVDFQQLHTWHTHFDAARQPCCLPALALQQFQIPVAPLSVWEHNIC